MSDWPKDVIDFSAGSILSTEAEGSPIGDLAYINFTSAVQPWSQANTAFFYPVLARNPLTVTQMGWGNGPANGDHVDVGLYDKGGTRLTSTGSTLTAGGNAIQAVDVSDVVLPPSLYYLAMVADGILGTFTRANLATAGIARSVGCLQQASAFPLPANATFATMAFSNAYLPLAATEGAVF